MTITGMEDFQAKCRTYLTKWYKENEGYDLTINETFVVWAVKALRNYKCLCSTMVENDGIYVEFTYNGDTEDLYVDVYFKTENICISL